MYLLLWMIVGGFIGWIASILTHNDGRMGIILNVVVGFIGSFIGGMIASLFNIAPLDIFTIWGLIFSLIGSVLFLIFINFVRNRKIL